MKYILIISLLFIATISYSQDYDSISKATALEVDSILAKKAKELTALDRKTIDIIYLKARENDLYIVHVKICMLEKTYKKFKKCFNKI